MFESLGSHDRIVVTGPQRSGTTICAQMIGFDLGYRYVDESAFGVYDTDLWRICLGQSNVVVQCPSMLKTIVDAPPPGVLVVLMRRSLVDIHRSEERIGWAWRQGELEPFGLVDGDSAQVKYDYWDAKSPPCSTEVDYESLAGHWAFVEKSQRVEFTPKQTSVDPHRPWVV